MLSDKGREEYFEDNCESLERSLLDSTELKIQRLVFKPQLDSKGTGSLQPWWSSYSLCIKYGPGKTKTLIASQPWLIEYQNIMSDTKSQH